MRLFVEISLALLLVALAWEKPLRERFGAKPPKKPVRTRMVSVTPTPAPLAQPPQTTPTANWMWDPNRPSTLDNPRLGMPKKKPQGQRP